MNTMLLSVNSDTAIATTICIVVLAIAAAFVIVSIMASVWKWVVVGRYTRFNRQFVLAGLSGSEVARKMLDALGLGDVTVEKLGFWKSLFIGNSYSPRKKAVRLNKNIYDKASLTSVAIAAQKVAIAQRHHEGDKKIGVRAVLSKIAYFAPFALIPLVALGTLLDFVIWKNIGWMTIAFTVFAFAYFIASFIVVILNIKIEKAANSAALENMKKVNLLTDDEMADATLLYKTYITNYWLEFWYHILFILWEIVKFFYKLIVQNKTNRKK